MGAETNPRHWTRSDFDAIQEAGRRLAFGVLGGIAEWLANRGYAGYSLDTALRETAKAHTKTPHDAAPKQDCPYPAHAHDCDCRGMGGDR